MGLEINKLGDFIKPYSAKNKEGLVSNLLGVSIEKEFMPSVANIVGTDLKKYSILSKGVFAFNPMHVGRDERLPIALYKEKEPSLVSPAYMLFKISDENVLLPDFLELLFKTDMFDHLCWYHTDASVRGGLSWDDFCNLELNIPPRNEQLKIIKAIHSIDKKINNICSKNALLVSTGITFLENYLNSDEEKLNLKLSDFIEIQSGFAYEADFLSENTNDTIMVSMSNASIGTLFSENGIKFYTDKLKSKYYTKSGDLFFPTRDLTQDCNILACPAIIPSFYRNREMILGTNLYKITNLNYGENTKGFVFFLMNSKKFRNHIKESATGTAILMIKKEDVLNYAFDIPKDMNKLNAVCEKFKSIICMLDSNFSTVKMLKETKNKLLNSIF